MDILKNKLNANTNYTAGGEILPEAERNNRTILESIWAHYHKLVLEGYTQSYVDIPGDGVYRKTELNPFQGWSVKITQPKCNYVQL